jgi:hypothetical protein
MERCFYVVRPTAALENGRCLRKQTRKQLDSTAAPRNVYLFVRFCYFSELLLVRQLLEISMLKNQIEMLL